ncbi:MAG: Uma2 family endonuclease [Leptothrix sp. (in: Bacteria)]|jgi:Uma2 family endonuclease|nr:Uma2 family endonuclease [Leptothrix sp. (in: b-proteobacteria)]HQY09308.1 Uma2 family endonuclease [Burkholderiaceae bacterium]
MGAFDVPLLARHRLSVAEYYRMAEAGIFPPDARVELIDGEVIDMAPQKSRHASAVSFLLNHLVRCVGDAGWVVCQVPLHLSENSEPEPDLMLLRPRADRYADAHPRAEDVLLLIEVADSSARYDREVKLPLYARHGVAHVWLVDLEAGRGRLRFYSRLEGGEYSDISSTEHPGVTPLPGLKGMAIDLSGLLG